MYKEEMEEDGTENGRWKKGLWRNEFREKRKLKECGTEEQREETKNETMKNETMEEEEMENEETNWEMRKWVQQVTMGWGMKRALDDVGKMRNFMTNKGRLEGIKETGTVREIR